MSTTAHLLSPADLESLAELRGTFHLGHTDDDASRALAKVEKLTGINLAVLWDFNDMWGLGGNSELVAVDAAGKVCEATGDWSEFLYQPDNEVDVSTLAGLTLGTPVANGDDLIQFGSFNYARRDEPTEELG